MKTLYQLSCQLFSKYLQEKIQVSMPFEKDKLPNTQLTEIFFF